MQETSPLCHSPMLPSDKIDGSSVAYSDNNVQHNLSDNPTIFLGGDAEESESGFSFLLVEATPKANQGEFVEIINELTYQWAARRSFAA